MNKIVDGEEVECSPEEEAAILAEWATAAQLSRADAAIRIDDTVSAIYGRYTRFAVEYEEREAQAQAYKDAGYAGAVPARVAGFANPAGLSAHVAADTILAQSAQLRGALASLGDLRMRKYEVLRAADDATAQAAMADILERIAIIDAAL